MVTVQENVSLKPFNTFRVEAYSRFFVKIDDEAELSSLFQTRYIREPLLILGGGSNILFVKNFEGLTIQMNNKGISCEQKDDYVLVKAAAGEKWNDLVNYCVENGFSGIENLALIPGSVGAAPVQNIGAYGVELKDVFFSCSVFEITTGNVRIFNAEDCEFDYRESIFKKKLKGNCIITSVTLKLSRSSNIQINYAAINQELQTRGINHPSIKDISSVVAHIRVNKLPDPSTIGNAGSFFKNPIISKQIFETLQSQFPAIIHYPVGDDVIKLAAGWLIESCGWKGKRIGNVATWKNQALVLVNADIATGEEIFNFSQTIIDSVYQKFGIILEREVNVIS